MHACRVGLFFLGENLCVVRSMQAFLICGGFWGRGGSCISAGFTCILVEVRCMYSMYVLVCLAERMSIIRLLAVIHDITDMLRRTWILLMRLW